MKTILNTSLVCTLFFSSCKKEPYVPNYRNTAGYVIGKEICHNNANEDYWLIDLTYYSNTPRYGDTLVLNGTTYNNVVKVKGLGDRLQEVGKKASFDFRTISNQKIQTTGCTASSPITYLLKELFPINQFEIL